MVITRTCINDRSRDLTGLNDISTGDLQQQQQRQRQVYGHLLQWYWFKSRYTPTCDSTVELSRVRRGAYSPVGSRDPVSNSAANSTMDKFSTTKVQFLISRPNSSWTSCEFNAGTHRRRDSTRQLRRVVSVVYFAFPGYGGKCPLPLPMPAAAQCPHPIFSGMEYPPARLEVVLRRGRMRFGWVTVTDAWVAFRSASISRTSRPLCFHDAWEATAMRELEIGSRGVGQWVASLQPSVH